MVNARSHNIFSVDTDHCLVTLNMFSMNNWERDKKEIRDGRYPDEEVLNDLKNKKAKIRKKIS